MNQTVPITRDHLLLLDTRFADPALPGRSFFCKDCIMVEGVLGAYPERAERLQISRHAYPRPRPEVIALLGEESQSLPALILADDAPDGLATGRHGDVRFVNEIGPLLYALHVRHGIPEAHP